MIKKFVIGLVGCIAAMPVSVSAQPFVPQCASAPIPDGGGATYNACNFCDFMQLINNVIEFVIQISFVLFVFVLIYAGFQLVASQGNPSAKNEAKEKLVNLFVGFLIVLAAWLIVDTVMKVLVDPDAVGPWNEIECGSVIPPNQPGGYTVNFVREGAGPDSYSVESEVSPPAVAEGELSQDEATALLEGADIDIVSSGGCTDRTNSTCTSLEGVKPRTLDRIKELQANVGEQVVITGGTETGHADGEFSHGNGYKIDLRTTPAVNQYIEENFTRIEGTTKWRDANGNIYYRHGPNDHWDVTVTQ